VVAGRFGDGPGTWGRRRLPVRLMPADSPPPRLTERRPTTLTSTQERVLHRAACELVAAATLRRPPRVADPALGGAAGASVHGAFVSLKRRGRLRGCCGMVGATTIGEALGRAAARTATEDGRLPAVSPAELGYLDLELWLLAAPHPIPARGEARREHVIVGRHGLVVRRGQAGGLLLPGVAVEAGLDAEGFLEQVCIKATLSPTAWKEADVDVSTFEAHVIGGPFDPDVAATLAPAPPRVTPAGHALLVLEGAKTAWRYDPRASAESLLAAVADAANVRDPHAAVVVGLAAASTEPCPAVADVLRAQRGPSVRPPAVAGAFYPA